jgi:hypothetical protein
VGCCSAALLLCLGPLRSAAGWARWGYATRHAAALQRSQHCSQGLWLVLQLEALSLLCVLGVGRDSQACATQQADAAACKQGTDGLQAGVQCRAAAACLVGAEEER